MKQKIAYEHVQISIDSGNTSFDERYKFRNRGQAVRVVLFVTSAEPSSALRIGIDSGNGTEILRPLIHHAYKRREGGNYFEAMMPVDFETSQEINVVATAEAALTADFKADLEFFIEDANSASLNTGDHC